MLSRDPSGDDSRVETTPFNSIDSRAAVGSREGPQVLPGVREADLWAEAKRVR